MAYVRGTTSLPTPPVAPPEYTPWKRIRHVLHGWDGSTWDITDGRNGVYLMPVAVEGMGFPDIDNFTISSPVVHGVEWTGWRATGRDVFWVIGVFEDSSDAWLKMNRDFWRIFRPGKTLRWEVILPDTNDSYNLNVRFKNEKTTFDRDPVKLGWAIYGITCFAEQVFWEGRPQSRIWYPGGNADFFGGTGGPPFTISAAQTIDNATLSNPGDVETYIEWVLRGPFTNATVGVNGLTTTVGSAIAGDTYVLNTDPVALTATKNNVDVMSSLGAFEYPEIQPGENIALSLAMTGASTTSSIEAFFTPRYLRVV